MTASSLDQVIAGIRNSVITTRDANGDLVCICGAPLGPIEFLCGDCSHAAERSRPERERALREQSWREEISSWAPLSGVPEWPWARLDNGEFTRRIRFPRLLAFAEKYEPKHGSVILSADTGDGKTSLAAAALYRLRDGEVAKVLAREVGTPATRTLSILRDLVWTTGFDVAKARRETSLGEGESRLVARAMSCRLLVLDEVGFEVQHDTVIQEIANARYVAEKPTIVTTGLDTKAFAKRYGDACFRRFAERGTVVEAW